MKTSTILQNAIKLKSWGVKHRRYLHQHPELALQEKETAHYCKSVLHSLGYKIQNSWGYGFTADLNIKRAKTRIAFRADMDALPINEKTMHNFKSKKPNIAHLCGHDAHMAIALTTAKLLKNNQASLKHNVRFIFQPSEEIPPGGALSMIKNGCLQSVTEIYGLHMWDNPLGKVSLCEGPLMAGIANFDIIIIGKGCHAAEPNKGLNPIEAVAYSIEQVKKIRNKLATKQDTILSITACNLIMLFPAQQRFPELFVL